MIEPLEIINQKYDGCWVYMIDCEEDEHGGIAAGKVVISSENRDNVIRKMPDFDDIKTLSSFRYAGKIPEGVHILL